MNTNRRPLDGLAIGAMLVLCLCWGLQQVAVKVAAPGIHPVLQIGLRSGLAALMVAALIAWRGPRPSLRDATFWPGLGAGILFALEFLCVAVALIFTTASHVSVFMYAAPVFVVLGLHWLVPGERMGWTQWSGVLLAFAGIVLAFADGFGGAGASWRTLLLGDGMALLAGVLWAATTLTIRTTALSEAPSTTTLLYQLTVAGLVLVAVPLIGGHRLAWPLTGVAWASMIFQTVVVGFATLLVWFWLLRRYLASRLSVFSFLTPLFGVAFGVLLLDDPVGLRFAVGAALVLAGIVLVNLPGKAGR